MRSLTREGKHDRRAQVVHLRLTGLTYAQIAAETGLSRTGVFDICKRHTLLGESALHDSTGGRRAGDGRTLTRPQESLLRGLIVDNTPDGLAMPEALWTRSAVGALVEQRLGFRMPVRTIDSYLARWGFTPRRPLNRQGKSASVLLNRWLLESYPAVASQSKAQGGQITWGGQHRVVAEEAHVPAVAVPPEKRGRRNDGRSQPLAMMSSVTNSGQRRWSIFNGTLDATVLIDFLQRLVKGARHKLFLIMDDLGVKDERRVEQWLAAHEDDIQAIALPNVGLDRPA